MSLKPDLLTVLYIWLAVLALAFLWHTTSSLLLTNDSTETIGKAMKQIF